MATTWPIEQSKLAPTANYAYAQGYQDGQRLWYDSSKYRLVLGSYQKGYDDGAADRKQQWKQQLMFIEVSGKWIIQNQLGY